MICKQVFIRTVYVYVIAYLVLLIAILGLMCMYPKPELHMLLNSHHSNIQDTFFKYYSLLAEWPLYALALLPLLWKKIKITIILAYYYTQVDEPHDLRTQILFNTSLLLLFVFAAMGAYSRVYLSQHFLSDVCVGSIIGFTTPFLMFNLCGNKILKHKNEEIR